MFPRLLQEGGLSLDRLQSFCLVAQAGGVTKAAKGDPAKQSLFSRQIKELEEFFGTELIRRKGRGVTLSEAGERLNIIARECFASLSDFRSECKGRPVEVVLGTGDSIIHWLLMPRLAELRDRIPNVRWKFLNLSTGDAVRRLVDGVIDFALVRKDAIVRPLQARSLGVMGYSLFIPTALEVSAGRKNGLRLLDGLPLVTLEGEGSFRSELAAMTKKQGMKVNIEVECSSFPLAARSVAKGDMAAILPSIAAHDLRDAGVREVRVEFLKHFDREMCLASNVRLARIRPMLQQVGTVLTRVCRF